MLMYGAMYQHRAPNPTTRATDEAGNGYRIEEVRERKRETWKTKGWDAMDANRVGQEIMDRYNPPITARPPAGQRLGSGQTLRWRHVTGRGGGYI